MKYAVLYQSKSGNTWKIANAIYEALETEEKILCDIDEDASIPEADFYFVGFGVHNANCGMDIVDLFENLSYAKFAVFVTCGFMPTKQYKEKIEKNITVWFPDDAQYYGMYMCQGKIEALQKSVMIGKMPHQEDMLKEMFSRGNEHPDEEDIKNAIWFVKDIVANIR